MKLSGNQWTRGMFKQNTFKLLKHSSTVFKNAEQWFVPSWLKHAKITDVVLESYCTSEGGTSAQLANKNARRSPGPVWGNYTWATVCGHSDKADKRKTFDARLWQTSTKSGIRRQCIHHVQVKSSIPKSFILIKKQINTRSKKSAKQGLKILPRLLYLTYNQRLCNNRRQ